MASRAPLTGGTVFVTVGTTKFDALIRAVDDPGFAAALAGRGYRRLVLQIGAGTYQPSCLVPPGASSAVLPLPLDPHTSPGGSSPPAAGTGGGNTDKFSVEWFRFAPSLAEHMAGAALVISHAGAGSLFEALRAGKVVIAVPNAILMDNHQAELAAHLAGLGHLFAAAPERLAAAVRGMRPEALTPYPVGDASGIVRAIDRLMGVVPE